MIIKIIIVVLLSKFFCYDVAGQDPYYWSGKKKIQLAVDSSRLILHTKAYAGIQNLKANLSAINEVIESNEMSIGSGFSMDISLDNKKAKLKVYKRIAEISQADFILPLYRNESVPFYFTNEIILQPKGNVSINSIIKLIEDGVIIKEKTKYNTFVLEVIKIENLFRFANVVYENGLVEWCHPNFKADIVKTLIPTDPLFPEQYYLSNTGQFSGTAGIDINAPAAWDVTTGCGNIRVVVVDDGVEAHEDLAGRVLPGFTPHNNGNGTPAAPDMGHGEACAGIIAASQNNLGISGIAPNSQIIPVNIFAGGETNNDIANGINWAWDPNFGNADIISNSWGFQTTTIVSDAIVQAITNARIQGRMRGGTTLGCIVVLDPETAI